MSAYGDHAFYNAVRERLEEEVLNQQELLVLHTTERNAGVIQGMQAVQRMMDEIYKKQTADDRPQN